MTLGELIAALENAPDPGRVLPVGFGNPHSYRGIYEDVAFELGVNVTATQMLDAARRALGATYEGWKGGEFTMKEYTDCWISEQGRGGGEQIGPVFLALLLASDQLDEAAVQQLTAFVPDRSHYTTPWKP